MRDLPLDETMTVLDVYCGVGLFSAFLAPRVKQLVGIEISPLSCADFVTNLDEYDYVSLYEAPAEDVLTGMNFHPDVIIMDPPRDGLGAKAVEGILAQDASYLAYFSCDPATLSRDARRLISGGYGLTKMVLFDMFPQTYHVESLTYWVRT
ncbi:MAG TPA: methyltransferase, partial [Anaerolineales bacterium]